MLLLLSSKARISYIHTQIYIGQAIWKTFEGTGVFRGSKPLYGVLLLFAQRVQNALLMDRKIYLWLFS